MDPYERRLAEEVLYLHSLWHQGPPCPNGPNSNPTAHERHPNRISQSLHYPDSIPFKNAHHTHRRALQIFGSKKPGFDRYTDAAKFLVASDAPWPCHEPSDAAASSDSGWPPFNPASALPLSSAEDLAKHAANQVQKRGLTACREFFSGDTGSGSGDEKSDSEDDDVEESEVQNFLVTLFMRDEELRVYYEKNWGKGEFWCLVCGGGSGKKKVKAGKRFKDCVALVQHATAILKTKKRRAHRAYGQAICRVLGWDINHLPTIGLPEEV